MGWWRALPLTAQLSAVGMIVGLLGFLATSAAGERQQKEARARSSRMLELQGAELVAARLGTSLASMSRAHRGFLLSGDDTFVSDYEGARRDFERDAARFLELTHSERMQQALAGLRGSVRIWQDLAVAPNIARRRSGGLAAFERGTDGAAGVRLGATLMDAAAALQVRMTRDLRDEMRVLELDADRAAAEEELAAFLIWVGSLAVFILMLTLLMQLVARALHQVTAAAEALDAGRYRDAKLPDASRAPNRELARLASTFDQLAASIEERELQLKEDIEKLKELERLKRDFISTVSHELRTPLTSMRGALGLMLGGKVGPVEGKGRDLLQIAMTSTERLIRLINDILDIEKMDAGQVSVRRDRMRLRPVVETTLSGLEAFARDQNVGLSLTTDAAADAELLGDADRLVQVLTNLVSNAVKFSPPGSTVELSIIPGDGEVTVRVRDHGPGISTEFAGRIFGRFQQAGGAESRRSGGTGLGLNIAKSIVELHAGRIGFEPAEGGGSTFWITFPTVVPIAAVADPRSALLIIEDDASMRDVLVAQFEPIARPVAVQSAEAALEFLDREEVMAIILDPGLPGMDGLAFAQRLRQNEKLRRLPIFLFSAREYSAEELRGSGIRAADAFVKSRDAESVLFERLRHELKKRD
jgi:signal transduction histidine kinase/CheY-like chemotaxis protein